MRKLTATFILLTMSTVLTSAGADNAEPLAPPTTEKRPHTREIHGYKLVDNYYWLREKQNPAVIQHLEAENAFTERAMEPLKPLQEKLYTEMLGRIKQTDLSVPARNGPYFYYSRTEEGKQYPFVCRKQGGMDGPEELLLDLNHLATGHTFMALGANVASDDHNLLAYSTDSTGYRQYTLHIKDLRTGQTLPEAIERVDSVVWAADNKTLFYVTEDAVSKRSDKLWRHVVGTDRNDLLYEEKDDLFDIGVHRSHDKQIIFLRAVAKTSNEERYLRADQPNGDFKTLIARQPAHEYRVEHYHDQLYIVTNRGAKNFRVVTAPLSDPAEKNWKEFIPHNPKVKIDSITFFVNHAVVTEKEGGLDYLRIVDMRSRQQHRIATDEPDYALSYGANPEFNSKVLRFNYQSMVTPQSVYDYDMETRQRTLMKRQEVLGGYDPKHYEATRIWATARDGVKVPVSVVYRRGTKFDGKAPLLLYAYGSYGASMAPTFSSNRISLLDRGAIYALAHIRGGGELGEDWREQGRMMKKMNTFTDFIDCADHLVKQHYTSTDRLVIQGGSAGGLLMGAVVNMRPDLFKAVVAQVPFVDVINTMLDPSLPLTTGEYLEWGNPNEKAAFDYMIKYSPYDNVKAQNYPAMLVMVSLNDSQVPYWEGTKFAAKLRDLKTDKNPLLLKANMGAGHGGASGRYDALREQAFVVSFMLWQMGLDK
jgi:oligopeptidase B